jgi:hypothetical protein
MRVCPKCNRTYTDETLFFCTDDGTQLVAAAPPPPAYQQPAPQPPQPAPQQYYQQAQSAPQVSFGQQQARKSKAVAKTAMILGIVSFSLFVVALVRLWYYWGIISRYNWGGRDSLFWVVSVPATLFLILAVPLALIAVVMSFKNPARYSGKIHAVAGIIPAAFIAVLVLGCFTYARLKAASYNAYNRDTYSYNSNSYSPNSNHSYNSNSNSTTNYNSSSSSSGAMSEDDKYRLFYAATKTGDRALMTQAAQKIGILDASGRPTSDYQSFLRNSITWAFKDSEFTKTVDTPEKARAYVMAHL